MSEAQFTKTDEAIVTALKAVLEFVIATQPEDRKEQAMQMMERTFQMQRDAWFAEGHQEGVGVSEQLRAFVAARRTNTESLEALLKEQPKGQA